MARRPATPVSGKDAFMSGKKGLLVLAAVAGILGAGVVGCGSTKTHKSENGCKSGAKCKGGGSCKGENGCKGGGSCKSGSGCKGGSGCGKNSCA
jgi:hypothetical protein